MRIILLLLHFVGAAARGNYRTPAAVVLALTMAGCGRSAPSSYFRVTAHLVHHDEPITLDWVVECRYTRLTGDIHGWRAAVVPYVFGVATRDGGMVLMVAPSACGLREPDRTNLPFFMWGDKAGDFTFFTAYTTRQAFDDPGAQIRVLDVDIRPSDRAEHDVWARTAPKNVVPDHPDPFRQDGRGRSAQCLGFFEMSVPATSIERVRRTQPPGKPPYWLTSSEIGLDLAKANRNFFSVINRPPLTEGAGLDAMHQEWPIDIFPFGDRDYFFRHLSGPDRKTEAGTARVKIDLDRPGMMSCGAMPTEADRNGLTVFELPGGDTSPIAIRPFDDTTIASDKNSLFVQLRITFDFERGIQDHE